MMVIATPLIAKQDGTLSRHGEGPGLDGLHRWPGKPHPIPHLERNTIDRCMLHGVQECSVFQGEDQLS